TTSVTPSKGANAVKGLGNSVQKFFIRPYYSRIWYYREMSDLFTLKLCLSFFVGGLYVVIATVFADKFGSKIGGLISGLPSTVLFGLLFIAWTQNTQAAVDATTPIPAVVGVACFFLI